MPVVTGKVPRPDIIEMICAKAGDGHGYNWTNIPRDRLGPGLIGPCNHITAGHASIEWYHDFFSVGGERANDALVDFVIGQDGRIGMLNDPAGQRVPWASGGSDGLEGIGIPFYQRYGPMQNHYLWSIEHVAVEGEVWPDPLWNSSIALSAYYLDQRGVLYTSYPVNQIVGLKVDYAHADFAKKPCPGWWFQSQRAAHAADVKARLQQFQVVDEKPPKPPVPPSIYPEGWDKNTARKWFGRLKRIPLEGRATTHRFNEKGAISLSWLARVRKDGDHPEALQHIYVADNHAGPDRIYITRELITFENGWVLSRLSDRDAWKWIA